MSSSESVPIIPLDACGDGCTRDRIKTLVHLFKEKFGQQPSFVVQVPGRVNLIGEHIDYCGFPVFPMAVDKSLLLAVASDPGSTQVNICNTDKNKYSDYTCDLNNIAINIPPKWYDYFLCGLKGVITDSSTNNIEVSFGINVLVDGTIPPAAGLSSSSAIVCGSSVASTLLLLKSSNINKTSLASSCASFERWIGTQGGGMDQAIQFLAEKGSAKFVEFIPSLKAVSVALPEGVSFFISHSGVECNKGSTNYYNIRVLETRLAALLLAEKLGVVTVNGITLSSLASTVKQDLDQMASLVKQHLKSQPYSHESLLKELNTSSINEAVERIGLDPKRFSQVIESGVPLKLHDRALHVYEEANRVYLFKKTCSDPSLDSKEKIKVLGDLMNDSHVSCRDLFECSCPELDSLVKASLSSGAIGSRLTGAGWGGCTISLVPEEAVAEYKEQMSQLYPHDRFTFNTRPSGGICVFSLL